MNHQEQNNALLESFMDRTFFAGWRNPTVEKYLNFQSLELILNYKCNLACKYCYVNRYGESLYPAELYEDEGRLLHNIDVIVNWLVTNNYGPSIELFSGEALVQRVGYQALHKLLDGLGGKIATRIIIPTNYTFLISEALTRKVEELLLKGQEVDIPISLSASFDGKHCEINRPFKHDIKRSSVDDSRRWTWEYKGIPDKRDDDYYDRAFSFASKWKFGFHPMVYSNKVEEWKDNFLWFQKMFEKHDIPWQRLYLLEVRNIEWTNEQIKEFGKFIEFLIEWTWNKVGRNLANYFDFLFKRRGFNILTSALSTVGRGYGCSMQSTLYLRVGDLAICPCHRQTYDHLIAGHMKVVDDRIVGVTARNPEFWIAEVTGAFRNFPYCETCMIKSVCSGGCLGSQFETTGDPFTPIPVVCQLEHEKIMAMIRAYERIGIFDAVRLRINPEKANAMMNLREMNDDE